MNWRLGAQPGPGPPDKKTRRTRDSMDYVAMAMWMAKWQVRFDTLVAFAVGGDS